MKGSLLKLRPRRYCICSNVAPGRQNCAVFRNKWRSYIQKQYAPSREYPPLRMGNCNGYIATFAP